MKKLVSIAILLSCALHASQEPVDKEQSRKLKKTAEAVITSETNTPTHQACTVDKEQEENSDLILINRDIDFSQLPGIIKDRDKEKAN